MKVYPTLADQRISIFRDLAPSMTEEYLREKIEAWVKLLPFEEQAEDVLDILYEELARRA